MTRTVTDMAQREVTLPAQIRKVATIGSVPALNSLMFAMGAGDMLVNGLPEPFSGTTLEISSGFFPCHG